MEKLARYVQSRKLAAGKIAYYFSPPPDVMRARIIAPEALGTDRERARLRAMHLNNQIDKWRNGGDGKDDDNIPTIKGTVGELIEKFLASRYVILELEKHTQTEYKRVLRQLARMEIDGTSFGALRLSDLKARHGDEAYDKVLREGGVVKAYGLMRIARRCFNVGIKWDMVTLNPFSRLEVKMPEARNQVWPREELDKVIKLAREEGRESVAAVIELAYETSARQCDLLAMRKSNYDAETGILGFVQRKTKKKSPAPVYLPIPERFAKWFLDAPSADSHVFLNEYTQRPYSREAFGRYFRSLCDRAGVSNDLDFRDIRRTVLTELGDGGATEDEIMSVSGHKNRQTVSVYVKKTAKQAANAITKLKALRDNRNANA